jgi:uncharacterized protein
MPIRFFEALRAGGLKPSVSEYLMLCEALKTEVIPSSLDAFHTLARAVLVKDESQFDRFDQIFGAFFDGIEQTFVDPTAVPPEWLQATLQRFLSDEEKAALSGAGSFEALMQTLRERLAEQRDQHAGGNRWIGTGGSSAFGNAGFHPEGVRIDGKGEQQKAVKVWQQRQYRDFDPDRALESRQLRMALRKLRQFARSGAAEELDLDGTISATARNAGWLDLQLQAQRRNAIKVLLLLDVGGSMDAHVLQVEALFHAARHEFKSLEFYYFHNFVYEQLWRENLRRQSTRIDLHSITQRFGQDYRLIFVGDASMSPYEILSPGGSVEHWNALPGIDHFLHLTRHFPHHVWLNPIPDERWNYTASIGLIQKAMHQRMFPISLSGLDQAIACLKQRAPA